MDVQEFFEYAGWALMAVIKFVITPSMMIGLGYSPWMTWLTTAAGAMIGVLVFTFWRLLFRWYDDRMVLSRISNFYTEKEKNVALEKSLGGQVAVCFWIDFSSYCRYLEPSILTNGHGPYGD